MRICDLRQKEVINIKDCKRLGYVYDIEFDRKTGCRVCQIGPDIILVDIDEGENQSEIKKNRIENNSEKT